MNNYSYLENKPFLKEFDQERHKTQYIRITVLDFYSERPLASIEGKSTSGSVNLNGTSAMRRTMSCSLLVDPEGVYINGRNEYQQYYNITEVNNLISMNKKVRLETGFNNTLASFGEDYYPNIDIIWFPLGTYVIKSASVSENNSGINISLTLNDKTALINGDMGGTIPAATVFSESELFSADGMSRAVEKILIKDLIKYLMIDFGGEKIENIIIEDIPDTIVKVVKWTGESDLYLIYPAVEDSSGGYSFSTEKPTNWTEGTTGKTYTYGQNVGYMNEPFVYPGTFECNAGETVSALLDKLKNTLGNFEWFYDINGKFHFQQIKNYLNTSQTEDFLNSKENDFLPIANYSKTVYDFKDKMLITSISNAPQFQNIKNDFVIWGTTKTVTGADKPIRYHLVFDKKPDVDINKTRFGFIYKDYKGLEQFQLLNNNYEFGLPDTDYKDNHYDWKKRYYLERENDKYIVYYYDEDNQVIRAYPEWEVCYLVTDDWHTELYFRGLEAVDKTFVNNYYAAELNAEWPKICDFKKEQNNNIYNLLFGGMDLDKKDPFDNIPVWSYEGTFSNGSSTDYLQFTQIDSETIRAKVIGEGIKWPRLCNRYPRYINFKLDKSYTLSFEIRANEENRKVSYALQAPAGGNAMMPGETLTIGKEWQKIIRTFAPVYERNFDCNLQFNINTEVGNNVAEVGNWIELRNVILEESEINSCSNSYINTTQIIIPFECKPNSFNVNDFKMGDWKVGYSSDTSLDNDEKILYPYYHIFPEDGKNYYKTPQYPTKKLKLSTSGFGSLVWKTSNDYLDLQDNVIYNFSAIVKLSKENNPHLNESPFKNSIGTPLNLHCRLDDLTTKGEVDIFEYNQVIPLSEEEWDKDNNTIDDGWVCIYLKFKKAKSKDAATKFRPSIYYPTAGIEGVVLNIASIRLEASDSSFIYKTGIKEDLDISNYEYYLDFLEGSEGGSQSISQFNVQNIGRRVKVDNGKANCIFPTEIPNFVIIEADGDTDKEKKECEAKGQEYIQVSSDIFKDLVIGGSQNSAYDRAKELLYTHTQYNESITIGTIPIYHLEPNTLINIEDTKTGLHGNYLIKTISLPLTPNGTSNIACTRCPEKTI